ncbi:Cdc14 phosphatase binding protein N-terminus-domain-containing protein [Dipodascopsis uninucleata]
MTHEPLQKFVRLEIHVSQDYGRSKGPSGLTHYDRATQEQRSIGLQLANQKTPSSPGKSQAGSLLVTSFDLEKDVTKKFIHLTNPGITIRELRHEIEQRYYRIYNDRSVQVEHIRDRNDCDLDDEYLVSYIFSNGDIVHVHLGSLLLSSGPEQLTQYVSDEIAPNMGQLPVDDSAMSDIQGSLVNAGSEPSATSEQSILTCEQDSLPSFTTVNVDKSFKRQDDPMTGTKSLTDDTNDRNRARGIYNSDLTNGAIVQISRELPQKEASEAMDTQIQEVEVATKDIEDSINLDKAGTEVMTIDVPDSQVQIPQLEETDMSRQLTKISTTLSSKSDSDEFLESRENLDEAKDGELYKSDVSDDESITSSSSSDATRPIVALVSGEDDDDYDSEGEQSESERADSRTVSTSVLEVKSTISSPDSDSIQDREENVAIDDSRESNSINDEKPGSASDSGSNASTNSNSDYDYKDTDSESSEQGAEKKSEDNESDAKRSPLRDPYNTLPDTDQSYTQGTTNDERQVPVLDVLVSNKDSQIPMLEKVKEIERKVPSFKSLKDLVKLGIPDVRERAASAASSQISASQASLQSDLKRSADESDGESSDVNSDSDSDSNSEDSNSSDENESGEGAIPLKRRASNIKSKLPSTKRKRYSSGFRALFKM